MISPNEIVDLPQEDDYSLPTLESSVVAPHVAVAVTTTLPRVVTAEVIVEIEEKIVYLSKDNFPVGMQCNVKATRGKVKCNFGVKSLALNCSFRCGMLQLSLDITQILVS